MSHIMKGRGRLDNWNDYPILRSVFARRTHGANNQKKMTLVREDYGALMVRIWLNLL